jgi:hypothetical protein
MILPMMSQVQVSSQASMFNANHSTLKTDCGMGLDTLDFHAMVFLPSMSTYPMVDQPLSESLKDASK